MPSRGPFSLRTRDQQHDWAHPSLVASPRPLTKTVPTLLAGRQSCHTSHLPVWPQSRELLPDSQSDPPILSGKGSSWAHSGGLCGGEGMKSPG